MHLNYDWITHQKQYITPLIESFKPKTMLEIGSFEGASTVYFLEEMTKYNDVQFISLDTWAGSEEHTGIIDMSETERLFDSNVQEFLENHKTFSPRKIQFVKYKTTSLRGMCDLIYNNSKFDCIYIDGSHEAADVFVDAALAFRLCNVNGLLIFDDYEWAWNLHENEYKRPKIAIDAFEKCFGDKIAAIATGGTYQKYYQKISE